jgi:hypothetical protein
VIQTRPRVQDDQGEAQGHGVAIDSQLRTDQVEKYAAPLTSTCAIAPFKPIHGQIQNSFREAGAALPPKRRWQSPG